jgi:hypothetical protein
MWSVEERCRCILRWWAGEYHTILCQTGFVVQGRIREMEIPVEFMIVEFNRDRIVPVLIYSPYETDQIQTKVFPVASPRCRARLKGFMKLSLDIAAFI